MQNFESRTFMLPVVNEIILLRLSYFQEEGNPIKGGPVDALIVYACDADRKGESIEINQFLPKIDFLDFFQPKV